MSKDPIILILGVVVAVVPFLGFPGTFESVIFVLSGAAIAILAFLIRRDMARGLHCEPFVEGKKTATFSQNNVKKNYDGKNTEADKGEGEA
ncbi:MAG: hypothetical protein ISR99_02090 [Parcubacteria group bacterium]|nr:hypothetical protein [Parcubacteria group bacterium]